MISAGLSFSISAYAIRNEVRSNGIRDFTFKPDPETSMRTSARNHFAGHIADVKSGAVNDEVILRTDDGLDIVAIITQGGAASLGLERNSTAFALVKASSVLVLVDFDSHKISARNCIAGTVSAVVKGAVNAEVEISVPEGAKIVSIITNDSVDRLGLAVGKPATAIFKASSVIVGIE
ncbi:TOBE domain protein [Paraburkholderia phytofirmans PsJN]|uniref:TOBE domain protein n=2 Tax=Paraburkholderia phytofirmans TaxID=261302 RepID=B2TFR2_PARPJ|nr:TOBE domain protein [Paraburkholderia phytofirmans PsJN]